MSFDELAETGGGATSASDEGRDEPAFRAWNGRRLDLIEKKFDGAGLSEAEASELAVLQKRIEDWLDERRPSPFQRRMLEELERRADELESGK
ncbi:MAG: hypothetical protein K2W96_00755 [Gemmataceae bacterium]|nr:hypothetical protein [Gemmataceae bacterium]